MLNYTKVAIAFLKWVTHPPVSTLQHINSKIPSQKAYMFACFSVAASEKQPPTTDNEKSILPEINTLYLAIFFQENRQAKPSQAVKQVVYSKMANLIFGPFL